MPCPFCSIISSTPPSPTPPNTSSPAGSAYTILSTPLVVAFLDIAPLSRGHLLLCPRAHREKVSELSSGEAATVGFWVPVLSRAVMRALWGADGDGDGEGGHWNVVQANGTEAGQTVPHAHFHVIPREPIARDGEMTDAERTMIALGEGPRVRLDAEQGERVSRLVKDEVRKEIQKMREGGELVGGDGSGELWLQVSERGLKL